MEYTTRAQWGARSPQSIDTVPRSQRTGFMVHYSGAFAGQSVRAIQDFHMDTRGWADIGYNWLVRSTTGEVYIGRGWDVLGAHCKGFNTPFVGVCVIGADKAGRQDVSDAARRAVVELRDEAIRHYGNPRGLVLAGHRDHGQTDCPGDELWSWVHHGMPLDGQPSKPPAPAPADWTEQLIMSLPTIKHGATGATVRTAQGLLVARGHATKVDGIFGDDTEASTRAMQRHYGAEQVDGIWGPETWTIGITGKDTR